VSPEARRGLGLGLLVGAGGITALMVAWLAVSGASGGGIVLGLLLLLVLAGPLAGAGWYVLARGRADQLEEARFAGKRRVLESDRLFRAELSGRLDQLAALQGMPSGELRDLSAALSRRVRDEAAWYDAVQLDDTDIGLLQRYDDLVWEQVRWLSDHRGDDAASLDKATAELRRAIEQRSDLLVRGRAGPSLSPATQLLAPDRRSSHVSLAELVLGDAITHDGADYVVDRLAISFSNGATWKLAHLGPSGADATEHWLSISPDAREVFWLDTVSPPPRTGAAEVLLGPDRLTLASERSGVVQVSVSSSDNPGVAQPGVLVRTWQYRADTRVAVVEQWATGEVVAYLGQIVDPSALEIWPGDARSSVRLRARRE
jgi:hypothetical protein